MCIRPLTISDKQRIRIYFAEKKGVESRGNDLEISYGINKN